MCYNCVMKQKEFKRCPRCNHKSPINVAKCGNCGLNYDKFNTATNSEAKSAFRMGENERVLYTKRRPNDVSKVSIFFKSLIGGWFGLHYFAIGRKWRGLFQILGIAMMFVYAYFAGRLGIRNGFAGNAVLVCGIIWVATFIIWWADSIAILFNRFKYPVSLPYSEVKEKKHNYNEKKTKQSDNNKNIDVEDKKGE